MKKTIATLAIIATLALTGCSSGYDTDGENAGDIRVENVKLSDGRTVSCVLRGNMNSAWGAISCDWDGAK